MKKAKIITILFIVTVSFIGIHMLFDPSNSGEITTLTPQQALKIDPSSYKVKESLKTMYIDELMVFHYIGIVGGDDYLIVTFFDRRTYPIYQSGRDLTAEYPEAWYFDNNNGNRVVWGYCSKGEAAQITVNGKSVKSTELNYTYEGKDITIEFWYAVFDGEPKFKVMMGDEIMREYPN